MAWALCAPWARAFAYPWPVLRFHHVAASRPRRFMAEANRNKFRDIAPRYDVRFGSKADICSAQSHVRFAPNSDRESGLPQTVMSALPPKPDMCSARADVRYGPIADMRHLIHSVGARDQRWRHIQGVAANKCGRFS